MTTPTNRAGLKPQERVRLWRLRCELSRSKAARSLRVSGYTWGEYERGERAFPQALPWTGSPELRSHERCLIARLRAGVSQTHVAAELRLSRSWVGRMERGRENTAALEQYWNI